MLDIFFKTTIVEEQNSRVYCVHVKETKRLQIYIYFKQNYFFEKNQ